PAGSTTLVEVVRQGASVTTVTPSANPVLFGTSVSFTATVTAASGSGTPSGTVTFLDGSTLLGYAALDAVGQATLTTSALAPGVHNITVVYGGDLRFSDSSSAPLPEVIQLATNTDLVSTANPAVFGQPLSFTATVTTTFPGMTPTGHVTFSVDNGPP